VDAGAGRREAVMQKNNSSAAARDFFQSRARRSLTLIRSIRLQIQVRIPWHLQCQFPCQFLCPSPFTWRSAVPQMMPDRRSCRSNLISCPVFVRDARRVDEIELKATDYRGTSSSTMKNESGWTHHAESN